MILIIESLNFLFLHVANMNDGQNDGIVEAATFFRLNCPNMRTFFSTYYDVTPEIV